MSNQEIKDRLKKEADNWIERREVEEAMAREKERQDRNRTVASIVIVGMLAILFLVGIVALVTR